MIRLKKTWSKFVSWVNEPRERALGLLFTFFTAAVLAIQTWILVRQADIMERQTAMSIRPEVATEVLAESASSPDRTGPWIIKNAGRYPIKNLYIKVLYFKKFDRGWMFASPSIPKVWTLQELRGGKEWSVDIAVLANMFKNRNIETLVPTGLEFIDLLLYFERDADGKQYVYLEPFYVLDGKPLARSGFFSSGGALARACAPEIELFFEYYNRQPFEGTPEVYNATYLSGYAPSGCLGEIKWVSDPQPLPTSKAPQ